MEKKSTGNLDFLEGRTMGFAGAGDGGVNIWINGLARRGGQASEAGTGIVTSPVVDMMPSAVDAACAIMVVSMFDDSMMGGSWVEDVNSFSAFLFKEFNISQGQNVCQPLTISGIAGTRVHGF
jgi:hypothetical protein